MFEFNDNKPIYRQIVDYAFNCIIEGLWTPGERIPSVRELAASLGVNSRTVLKAMEELQDFDVIRPKRGMGFLLDSEAVTKVLTIRKNEFYENTVPAILQEMKRLGIPMEELIEKLNENG